MNLFISKLYLAFLIVIAIFGCKKPASQRDVRSKLDEKAQDSTELSTDSLYNASINDYDCGWIKFENLEYESYAATEDENIQASLSKNFVFADLNGDGYKDAIGSYRVHYGRSSGKFISLVIFLNKRGSAVYSAAFDLGDRIGPDSIIVKNDTINLYYMERTKDEPMADKGSILIHKKLRLIGNKLIELK